MTESIKELMAKYTKWQQDPKSMTAEDFAEVQERMVEIALSETNRLYAKWQSDEGAVDFELDALRQHLVTLTHDVETAIQNRKEDMEESQ